MRRDVEVCCGSTLGDDGGGCVTTFGDDGIGFFSTLGADVSSCLMSLREHERVPIRGMMRVVHRGDFHVTFFVMGLGLVGSGGVVVLFKRVGICRIAALVSSPK